MFKGYKEKHFSDLKFDLYFLKKLEPQEQREVSEHISTCSQCQKEVAFLSQTILAYEPKSAKDYIGKLREKVEAEGAVKSFFKWGKRPALPFYNYSKISHLERLFEFLRQIAFPLTTAWAVTVTVILIIIALQPSQRTNPMKSVEVVRGPPPPRLPARASSSAEKSIWMATNSERTTKGHKYCQLTEISFQNRVKYPQILLGLLDADGQPVEISRTTVDPVREVFLSIATMKLISNAVGFYVITTPNRLVPGELASRIKQTITAPATTENFFLNPDSHPRNWQIFFIRVSDLQPIGDCQR